MKALEANYFNIGPRLSITFALLIALIAGGNGLLIWQFRIAQLQAEHLAGVSQKLIAVLRLQESLTVFHQRMDELSRSRDARRMVAEAEPLRRLLLEQTRKTRESLSRLPPETRVEPSLLPTLEAIEITLPSQLQAVSELAMAGDWDAAGLRLGNELKPFETQTSGLVNDIDQQVNGELTESLAKIAEVQRETLIIVPVTAICTFVIAAFFGWAMTRQIAELRLEERVSERMRITRELHDTLLQTLQGSKLVADDALESPDDPVRIRHAVEQISLWLAKATQEGRAALNSLRESATEKNDLAEAFGRAIDECRRQTPIDAGFSVAGDLRQMHPVVRDEIYRIGYEAIRNASMHSQAGRLDVWLTYGHSLTLRVADDGVGIAPEVLQKGRQGHFGLQGMRERAARIGAKISIASSASLGTEIKLVVPGGIIFRARGTGSEDLFARWLRRARRAFRRS
jgi:signal transduction histidine kinase